MHAPFFTYKGAEDERDIFMNIYAPSLKARARKGGVVLDVVDCKRVTTFSSHQAPSATEFALSNIEDLSSSSSKGADQLYVQNRVNSPRQD